MKRKDLSVQAETVVMIDMIVMIVGKNSKSVKKESNLKCDCCRTTGIVRKLRALRGTSVAVEITTSSGQVIEGTVESVDCHTADITATRSASNSFCL